MTSPEPVRRVQRIRHDTRNRELTVTRVAPVGRHFLAVTLAGPELAGFTSLSFDDHVKLFFQLGNGEIAARDYTPRRYDAAENELTIEFALHRAGPASDWARSAKPGDRLVIGGPRGSFVVPTDYKWHLLAGDESALPAIRRRVEELPPGGRVMVLPETADDPALQPGTHVELHQMNSAEDFLACLRSLNLPEGDGYAWAAGEAGVMAQARQILLNELGHPKEAARIAAYWKSGEAAHHSNLD